MATSSRSAPCERGADVFHAIIEWCGRRRARLSDSQCKHHSRSWLTLLHTERQNVKISNRHSPGSQHLLARGCTASSSSNQRADTSNSCRLLCAAAAAWPGTDAGLLAYTAAAADMLPLLFITTTCSTIFNNPQMAGCVPEAWSGKSKNGVGECGACGATTPVAVAAAWWGSCSRCPVQIKKHPSANVPTSSNAFAAFAACVATMCHSPQAALVPDHWQHVSFSTGNLWAPCPPSTRSFLQHL